MMQPDRQSPAEHRVAPCAAQQWVSGHCSIIDVMRAPRSGVTFTVWWIPRSEHVLAPHDANITLSGPHYPLEDWQLPMHHSAWTHLLESIPTQPEGVALPLLDYDGEAPNLRPAIGTRRHKQVTSVPQSFMYPVRVQ